MKKNIILGIISILLISCNSITKEEHSNNNIAKTEESIEKIVKITQTKNELEIENSLEKKGVLIRNVKIIDSTLTSETGYNLKLANLIMKSMGLDFSENSYSMTGSEIMQFQDNGYLEDLDMILQKLEDGKLSTDSTFTQFTGTCLTKENVNEGTVRLNKAYVDNNSNFIAFFNENNELIDAFIGE